MECWQHRNRGGTGIAAAAIALWLAAAWPQFVRADETAGATLEVTVRLLQDAGDGAIAWPAASALYASHAARGLADTDRRWWAFPAGIDAYPGSEPVRPFDAAWELPAAWADVAAALDAAPAEVAAFTLGFRRVRRGPSPAILRRSAALETEHFAIEVDAAANVWPAIAATCETTVAVLEELLDLSGLPPGKMRVAVAKDRGEYLRLLGRVESRIAVTSGYFDPAANVVYCYWDGREETAAALRHEVTHQVLTNAWAGGADPAWRTRPDFWAYEAVAAYAESVRVVAGYGELLISAGGWDAPRLQAARYRRLHDLQWVDWAALRANDADRFQAADDIQLRYSQSAGLAHMFFDAEPGEGGAAEEFSMLLEAVHRGRPAGQFLDGDGDQIRRHYDRFLLVPPVAVAAYGLLPPRADVVLSRCEVGPGAPSAWPEGHRRFDWLDLSFTRAGGEWLGPEWEVRRLNLESNPLGPADVAAIAAVESLEELDVSDCGLAADAIEQLCRLPNLRRLWISGNPVGDEVLEHLLAARRLEHADVQRTQVTPEAWQAFVRRHPRVR